MEKLIFVKLNFATGEIDVQTWWELEISLRLVSTDRHLEAWADN